jgi:hypothetical protein
MKGKYADKKTPCYPHLQPASPALASSSSPSKPYRTARREPQTAGSRPKAKAVRNRLKEFASQIMPKPTHRRKTPKYLRSRNWRSHDENYNLSFSEESIQRQLNYLVPRYDHRECCWHECAWEGYVWCCGHTCWAQSQKGDRGGGGGDVDRDVTAHEEKGYFTQNKGEEEDASSDMSTQDISKSGEVPKHRSCEVKEEMRDETQEKEEEKPVARPRRQLYRDEWDCDFCGPKCFCDWAVKVEVSVEAMC